MHPYLAARARQGGRLAIVLGIDNVALATHYDWPKGVRPTLSVARPTLSVARQARALGMAVFFVTGRPNREVRRLVGPLRRAGFEWNGLCGRPRGVRVRVAKQRCRQAISARGYTVTANISSHQLAFYGGYYERGFMLPNYGGRLT
ncbi:HAD family acid phosphatase [Nocardioides sp. CER19]|uniref:HAD family acid phosphatase n=1 Tax=Nocardioides sp. CER19 TaxID=3038538 RepID=UPI002447672E|nr:HAD family acid phosphatase [Nocardioides sp. CER19]MDH2415859.1 HAD family acid phosphatase [Nocardioides sp. CER19]